MYTTAPALLHSIAPVFGLAVFSFLFACSTRAAATFQTAVASSFRPLQRERAHSHISGGWWDVVQLFVRLSGWLSHLHLRREKQRQHGGVRRAGLERGETRGDPAHHLCSLFFFVPTISLPVKGGSSTLLGVSSLQESLAPATSPRQLKAEMGATGSHTKAELQQTISEQGRARIPP